MHVFFWHTCHGRFITANIAVHKNVFYSDSFIMCVIIINTCAMYMYAKKFMDNYKECCSLKMFL